MAEKTFSESVVEEAVRSWLVGLDYGIRYGPTLSPGETNSERGSYGDVVLLERPHAAVKKLNPKIPQEALDEAARKVTRSNSPSPIENNRRIHKFLIEGVPAESN